MGHAALPLIIISSTTWGLKPEPWNFAWFAMVERLRFNLTAALRTQYDEIEDRVRQKAERRVYRIYRTLLEERLHFDHAVIHARK